MRGLSRYSAIELIKIRADTHAVSLTTTGMPHFCFDSALLTS